MSSPINPAYHIPLQDLDLVMIGEICAIQGQIEYLMQNIVRQLLAVKIETVLAILCSTSIKINANIWINIVREKCNEAEALKVSEEAFEKMESLVKGRNDFVHAIYAQGGNSGSSGFGSHGWT